MSRHERRIPYQPPIPSFAKELVRHEILRALIHWILAGIILFICWAVYPERIHTVLPLILILFAIADIVQWIYTGVKLKRRRHDWAETWQEGESLATLSLPDADTAEEAFYLAQARQLQTLANREISEMQSLQQDYREFIELWVHEIKTPINIQNLILSNHPLPKEVQERLERSIHELEHQVNMVLYYARSRDTSRDYLLKKVDPAAIARSVIRSLSDLLIERDVQVQTDFIETEVLCDEKWLRFMITQVINNALQYAGDKQPKLYLMTHRTAAKAGLDPFVPSAVNFGDLTQLNDYITGTSGTHLVIRDEGIGIRPHELTYVTDKGFTGLRGRSYHRSTGMGLYIVRSLAEKLGMMMAIFASESGTAIVFSFPLS